MTDVTYLRFDLRMLGAACVLCSAWRHRALAQLNLAIYYTRVRTVRTPGDHRTSFIICVPVVQQRTEFHGLSLVHLSENKR